MGVLDSLQPREVFRFFEEMCAIPHGSGHTKAISDYCVKFALDRDLRVRQDAANNVVIWKGGTPGYEQAQPVIIQGHMDMVCEKEAACTKDMEKEGLDLFVEGDVIGARGTTLGGDDGIAVAMGLAILDSRDIPHPPLELVITVDEEIGMLGAAALDGTDICGRVMLNIDSEVEGVLTVSCAGANVTTCRLPVKRVPWAGTALRVTVGGLIGGHSGNEIDKGRGNSSLLMGRVLNAMARRCELRLVSAVGGLKDNAIALETVAQMVTADEAAVRAVAGELDKALKREYQNTDPGVFVKVEEGGTEMEPMDADSTRRAVCMLTCLPNGVQVMSSDIPGLVQTSLNMGILRTDHAGLSASFCVRSSLATQKQMLVERMDCLMQALGGSIDVVGDYPAWEYRKDSPLRELMSEVFRRQYGREPKVEAIHAGVECGLLSGKLPGLDCVSYGPDLTEIHTFRERMHIASVQRVWAFTLEILKRLG